MEKRVLNYVNRYHMIEEGDKVVVGVSGGADSVCLFFILLALRKKLDFDMGVVHVNHNLRGEEALRDERFVEALCKKYQVQYQLYSYDVQSWAAQEKIGLEEAGRLARMEAFSDSCKKWGGTKIALAHHQNDVAETMLYHLARGTSVAGLCSIKPIREEKIRPLLCMNRVEIEHYLKEHNIDYVTDSTNLSTDYTRNKIRHKVLPCLEKEINHKCLQHMASTAEYMGEVESYLLGVARQKCKEWVKHVKGDLYVDGKMFEEHIVVQKYMLRICIGNLNNGLKDITSKHIEDIIELKDKEVGKEVILPARRFAKRMYDGILLGNVGNKKPELTRDVDNMQREQLIQIPGKTVFDKKVLETTLLEGKLEEIPEKTYTKWLDYGKIKGKLALRTRQTGDYIIINQNGGRKKLKDFFINEKIPKEERDGVLLVAVGSNVLWAIGYRMSEYCKVTNETKEILKIQVIGGNNNE